MKLALDILAIVLIGTLIGAELTVSAFINPVLARIGGSAEAQATRLFAGRLGAFMPFWYGLCLLLLIAETVLRRGEAGALWIAAAGVLWLVAIIMSVTLLVPINNRIASMNPGDFEGPLRAQHRRWERLHRGRVAVLSLALVILLLAIRV